MPNYYTKAHLKTVVLFLKILICIGVWWWWWCSCSVMSDSAIPWTVTHQASLSMGFSRQEYWSGFPFPSPH